MTQFLNPADLNKMAEELELAKRRAEAALRLQAEQVTGSLRQAFEAREITAETPERINTLVRRAAEEGKREILVLRFPSTFCKDGGRGINNFEPDWPKSLEGFSRTAFEYYAKELQPLGYSMRAEIMNFPNGMPGDVGMYLRW